MSATNRDHKRGSQPLLEHSTREIEEEPAVSGLEARLVRPSVICSVRAEKDRAHSHCRG